MPTPPLQPTVSDDDLERLRRFAELLQGEIVLTGTQLVFAWLLQQLNGEALPHAVLAWLAAAVRPPLAEFLDAHPEVAEALGPAWERIEQRWREGVRGDALSRARPQLVRREPPREERTPSRGSLPYSYSERSLKWLRFPQSSPGGGVEIAR